MSRKLVLLITTSLLLSTIASFSQSSKQIQKLKNKANRQVALEEWHEALPLWIELDSLQPNDAEINYRLGESYFNTVNQAKALNNFLVAERGNYPAEDLDYYLGRAYHYNHRFEDAIAYYKKYDSKLDRSDDLDKQRHLEILRYLQNCESGQAILADSILLRIQNIGPVINSRYPDYVPVVSSDESMILFTSRRNTTTGGKTGPDGLYYEDVYLSTKTNGNWEKVSQLSKPINTRDHDACIGLSPDGKTLYLYKDTNGGDIYISQIEDDNVKKWGKPEKLEGDVNSEYWEGSASVSADGQYLYISSDREGGYGGSDIYRAQLQSDGTWGKVTNLGPDINTPYDEDAPQIHADGKTMFFSSRGHSSIGGYDIFSSVLSDNSRWSEPRNIGYPVNTANDDIYFSLTADGSKGYFTSYRHDTYGEKDIYIMYRPLASPTLFLFKGKVVNKDTQDPVAAQITLINKATNESDTIVTSDVLSGRYAFNMEFDQDYELKVESDGFLFRTDSFNVPYQADIFEYIMELAVDDQKMYVIELDDTTQTVVNEKGDLFGDTPLADGERDNREVTEADLERAKAGRAIILRNVHFDFNKSTLKRESIKTLNQVYDFLAENGSLYFEIGGHTDAIGSMQYNQRLSERRAQAVYKYLTTKGIADDHLSPKGYGETKPVATNQNPEGRRLNRRAEMKRTSAGGDFIAHHGEAEDSQDGYLIWEQLSVRAHFPLNAAGAITQYSKNRLRTLINILKNTYPDSKVMIIGYDDFDVESADKQLPERRATTVFNHLVSQGIPADNLVPRSYRDMDSFLGNTAETPGVRRRKVEFYLLN